MTSNVREFNLALEQFAQRQVPDIAIAVQQKFALDGLRGVVMKSPVDTGRFRANHHLTVGVPSDRIIPGTDKQARGSRPGGITESQALAEMSRMQPYGIVYIQNGLPYAQKLEDGSSNQAPQGIYALTFAELSARVIEENSA